MLKIFRTCPACKQSKPLRKFQGKIYEDGIIYLSSTCTDCSGKQAVTPTQIAQQRYFYYVEVMICLNVSTRSELSRKEALNREWGVTLGQVEKKLTERGLRPSPQDVEAAWYDLHATRVMRSANWYQRHPVDPQRKKLSNSLSQVFVALYRTTHQR